VIFTETSTSRPSDSFPGLTALVTGGSPRSTGAFYDVSYVIAPCRRTKGGQRLYRHSSARVCTRFCHERPASTRKSEDDERSDIDYTKLDAGGGIKSRLSCRGSQKRLRASLPASGHRVNTLFEVVKASGGYTAWSDKHQSYELTNGPAERASTISMPL